MVAAPRGVSGGGQVVHRSAAQVLADRIAAAMVRRKPGWRLPRHTVLARRYGVSTAEIEVALAELAARQLIRRLPDGQLYLASPVEQLIPLEGVPGLGTLVDPMGGQIVCQSREAALSEVPGDIGWVLRVPPPDQVGVVRTEWTTAYGEPAAFCTAYLLRDIAAPFLTAPPRDGDAGDAAVGLALWPIPVRAAAPDGTGDVTAIGRPGSVHLELRPPPPAVARRLRLAAGQPAVVVTTRFDDLAKRRPVALTTAVFRADLFRIVVQAAERPPDEGGAGSVVPRVAWARSVTS